MNRRFLPPQDYGPLFSPEQIAARRRIQQRADEMEKPPRYRVNIEHADRLGERWRFTANCTTIQERILRNLLAGVRNIGNRDALTLSWASDAEGNARFCRDLEKAVLFALSELFPAEETRAAKVKTQTPRYEPPAPSEPAEEQAKYWWNND